MKAVSLLATSRMHRRDACINFSEPVVSFTFDDAPRSAVLNGESILKRYSYSGTYYISIGLMRNSGFDFDRGDGHLLQQIVESGGELACHTFSHLHFFKSNRKEIITDLEKNQEFIERYVPGYKFENFSYPYGEQSSAGRDIIKSRFKSGRSVYKGVNMDKSDLNCLRGVRLYESINLEETIGIIDTAIKTGGWIIFYTHDVEPNPSKNGCSPGYFEAVVKYCFEKKLKVLPVNRVLDLIDIKFLNK